MASNSQSQQQRLLVGGAPWEEMVQAWDPESMLAVEASTPPLDAAGHRAPLLTVPAFADALKRALEQEQQHQHQTQQEQEQGQGLWWDDDDPFGGLDDFGGMGIASPTCHPLAAPSAPDCGAGSSSTHNASTTSLGSSTASRPGTATPDIFAAPCAQQAPAAAVGEATTTTDDEEERDDEGLDIDIDDLHSLALPPTPPLALGHGLAPFAAPEPPVRPAAAAPSRLLVRFPGAATDAAAAQLKSAKQYLGPLACDPSIWASWGLPPHAWATFQRQVNADPAAVPAHVAALLAAARAGGSGLVAVEEQPEGNGAVLALPAGAARPAAALDVLIADPSNPTTGATTTPLLDALAQSSSSSLWARYFHPHPSAGAHARGAAAARAGDTAGVYDFLCAYLFGGGAQQHWEEAALTNGLRVVLHPVAAAVAAPAAEQEAAAAAVAAEVEEAPLLILRGASLSLAEAAAVVTTAAAGGFPLLMEQNVEEGADGDLEAQLGMLFDGDDAHATTTSSPAPEPVPTVGGGRGRGKQLSRLVSAKEEQEREEEDGMGGSVRRSGRARRAAGRYAVDYADADAEEEESEAEAEKEEEEEEEEAADTGLGYAYPGKPEPAGKGLPDRGRHKCRVPGCVEEYRWPDYFCKVHGGGRCQYMWWDESIPRCTKFHQSRNSNGELLCGEHSRATGARYGEQSRKAKGGNNKGKASGASSAAAKAKKSQRVVKRKVW